jgi:hypothetical protein
MIFLKSNSHKDVFLDEAGRWLAAWLHVRVVVGLEPTGRATERVKREEGLETGAKKAPLNPARAARPLSGRFARSPAGLLSVCLSWAKTLTDGRRGGGSE